MNKLTFDDSFHQKDRSIFSTLLIEHLTNEPNCQFLFIPVEANMNNQSVSFKIWKLIDDNPIVIYEGTQSFDTLIHFGLIQSFDKHSLSFQHNILIEYHR